MREKVKRQEPLLHKLSQFLQAISNRYHPYAESDGRFIRVGQRRDDLGWSWELEQRRFRPKTYLDLVGISLEDLVGLHEALKVQASYRDPMEKWYELTRYISIDQRKHLKRDALAAESLYECEVMLRRFLQDATGKTLFGPHEDAMWQPSKFYGERVTSKPTKHLYYLLNKFRLSPFPNVIVVVEGDTEAAALPTMAEKLFGGTFDKLGIEVINLRGVANFTGSKKHDKYGALERLTDYHHYWETPVYVTLDNEGRAKQVASRLIEASSRHSKRKVTKPEQVVVWERNFEYDNFTDRDIARAIGLQSPPGKKVTTQEIASTRIAHSPKNGDGLGRLYLSKTRVSIDKIRLAEDLTESLLIQLKKERRKDIPENPPIVGLIYRIVQRAAQRARSVKEDWRNEAQVSGLYGEPT